jgi:hypothetical protein
MSFGAPTSHFLHSSSYPSFSSLPLVVITQGLSVQGGYDAHAENAHRRALQPNAALHLGGNPLWLVSIYTPFSVVVLIAMALLDRAVESGARP